MFIGSGKTDGYDGPVFWEKQIDFGDRMLRRYCEGADGKAGIVDELLPRASFNWPLQRGSKLFS